MGQLRLALLGTPEVRHAGRAVTFPTRKALALLAYLAVEGGRHTREKLAALLWPESDAEQARGSLRYTLTALRAATGAGDTADDGGHYVVDRRVLGIDAGGQLELDTRLVEAAYVGLARAQGGAAEALERAAEVCRGEFLEGFSLPDAPDFDEWVEVQRTTWRGRAATIVDRLSQAQWDRGALDAALETATRWLRLDQLDQRAHQRLIQLHLAAGDAPAALRAYEACRAILDSELGVEPSPELESLAQQARTTAHSKRPELRHGLTEAPLEIPLVGRAEQLRKGIELYHAARQGRPQVLSIEGEAGIGKTRLADELLGWAAGQGADVLHGRAFEMGGRLPYQPLLDAVRPRLERENAPEDLLSDVWLSELSRVLPELRERYPDLAIPAGDEVVARTRLFEALARLGQALAERAPVVLFVDDVQSADAASLDVLHYVGRRWTESGARVLVVLSVRAEALDSTPALREWLLSLHRDVAMTRLELGALSQDDTAALVRGLTREGTGGAAGPEDGEVEEFARRLFAETGGQPFFVTETLRSLLDRGALARVALERGAWGVALRPDALGEVSGGGYASPEVREVIRVRLGRLSGPAQVLLAAAAVFGQGFDFARLCRVADLPETAALPALDETLRAHLLREIRSEGAAPGSTYGFSHDKLRDVTYEEAGDARRRVFHRRALETLGEDAAPAELARHALAAGLEEQALGHSMAAGDAAMRVLAARDAITHYSTAIALAERLGRQDRLVDLRARRARAYASVTMWAEARREFEATLEALGPDQDERRGELLVQASAAYFWLADIPSLRRSAGEAIERAQRVGRGDLEMSALGWMAGAEGADGRLDACIEHYDRAVARARELGTAPPAHVLSLHALVLYWTGRLDEATERSRASVAAAREANDASILMYSLPHLGMALAARGQYGAAQTVFDDARRFGREYAIHTLLARAIAMSSGWHLDVFDFERHEALAREAREMAFSAGFSPPAASAGIDLLLNYARRGEVGRAEGLLDEVAATVEKAAGFHGWLWRLRLAQARAEIALARGAWEDALHWSQRAIEQSSTTARPKYRAAGMGARFRALEALGRRAEALANLREAVALAAELDDPALFLRLASQLLCVDGDDELAARARAAVGRIGRELPDAATRGSFEAAEPVGLVMRSASA